MGGWCGVGGGAGWGVGRGSVSTERILKQIGFQLKSLRCLLDLKKKKKKGQAIGSLGLSFIS